MNFFKSVTLAKEYKKNLQAIESKNPTASEQGKNECCQSGVCCWRRPGYLVPDDVSKISEYLEISEQELFESFLVVDEIYGKLLLLPRRKHQTGGTPLYWRETYSLESPCVWLDTSNNACTIHDIKPQGCKEFKCWEKQELPQPKKFPQKKLLQIGWSGTKPSDIDNAENTNDE